MSCCIVMQISWQAHYAKQWQASTCNICQKQLRTFAVKECGAATPTRHMLHVPQKCEHAQSHVFSAQSQSAGWQTTHAKSADWTFVSTFCACSAQSNESRPTRLSIRIYFHPGVKTRWKKKCARSVFVFFSIKQKQMAYYKFKKCDNCFSNRWMFIRYIMLQNKNIFKSHFVGRHVSRSLGFYCEEP